MQCIGRTRDLRRCKNQASTKWLCCKKHRLQPLVLLISLITFAISIVGAIDPIERLVNKKRITITPTEITPRLDSWKNQYGFVVHNPNATMFYAIWVQVSLEEHRFSNERIIVDTEISPADGRSFVALPKEVALPPDIILMTGKDSAGLTAMFLVIRSLEPGASLSFNMTSKSRTAVDERKIQIKYLLKIVSASSTQDRFKSKDKHFKVYFDKMPKGLTICPKNFFAVLQKKGEK
jgi:hypothetical protein